MGELDDIQQRVDEIEARVRALEAKSPERVPGEICPVCGDRAMRLKEPGRRLGGRDAYRFDTWACTSIGCDYSEQRKVEL
jgi:hypothetical protein